MRLPTISCRPPFLNPSCSLIRVVVLVCFVHRLRRVVQKLDSLKGGVKLRFFTLIFWWFLIAHWFACLWWFIGRTGYQDAEYREKEGLPRRNDTTWLVRIPPTGTAATGFSVAAFDNCVARCAGSALRPAYLHGSYANTAPLVRLCPCASSHVFQACRDVVFVSSLLLAAAWRHVQVARKSVAWQTRLATITI